MKIFVYKTLFIFASIFIIFQLTIGLQIKQIENKIEKFKSKENIENVKNKIRKELRSGIKKENYLTPEDAKLINDFINKLNKELSK